MNDNLEQLKKHYSQYIKKDDENIKNSIHVNNDVNESAKCNYI